MTTTETQTHTTAPVPMPTTYRVPDGSTVRGTITDCPAYAWRNIAEKAQAAFYGQLDADFVHDYRAELDAAATKVREDGTSLFGAVLAEAWTEQGYLVSLHGEDGLVHQRRPHGFPWHLVWDTAASRLDPHAVVIAAGLDDELLRYAAARPRTGQLDRHCKALHRCTQQLRDELHVRLDAFAETADCPRAEHQLDGWRHLVDTATTRAQLEHLAAEIPS